MKKRMTIIITVMLLLAVTTAAFASSAEEAAAEPVSVFPAGSPDEVAAVILHTNDVHAGYADIIGDDGLVQDKK